MCTVKHLISHYAYFMHTLLNDLLQSGVQLHEITKLGQNNPSFSFSNMYTSRILHTIIMQRVCFFFTKLANTNLLQLTIISRVVRVCEGIARHLFVLL